MKTIRLTQGKQATVDDSDYAFLSQWKWSATKRHSGIWYAVRYEDGNAILMHRILLGHPCETDHKNGNGLDNRRQNLRACTRTQNQQNRRGWILSGNSSQFKGVWLDSRKGRQPKWTAQIVISGQKIRQRFADEYEAARWYDRQASLYFGEFARLNFAEA